MFSCFARRLAKNNVHTLEALMDQLTVSYTPSVTVGELSLVFHIKIWMEGSINQISGHIHQHAFKVQNDIDGRSRLFYKKWTSSPMWLPDGGIRLISTIRRGGPKLVKPNTTGGMSLDKLKQDLPKYTMKFQESELVWWRKFITRQRKCHQWPNFFSGVESSNIEGRTRSPDHCKKKEKSGWKNGRRTPQYKKDQKIGFYVTEPREPLKEMSEKEYKAFKEQRVNKLVLRKSTIEWEKGFETRYNISAQQWTREQEVVVGKIVQENLQPLSEICCGWPASTSQFPLELMQIH